MTTATRADIRAQRRFAAMIDARDYTGREAALYVESERLVDATQLLRCPCGEYMADHPAVACTLRDEPSGDNAWESGYARP